MKKSKKTCEYCNTFFYSDNREIREDKGSRFNQYRYCDIPDAWVKAKTIACENFTLSKWFFCIRDSNFIMTEVCLSRQESEKEGCMRCRQGRLIKSFIKD